MRLVAKVVPQDRLMDEAMVLATAMSKRSPTAVRFAKRAMNTIEYLSVRDGYRLEQDFTHDLTETADAKEAVLAFREKREPKYD